MQEKPIRIAMWSGPRNISTAMMRSFSSRPDCAVSDEPFYGCYLKQTQFDHPMSAEIIDDMDCDWNSVSRSLNGDIPAKKPVWYQKHMWHHMTGPVTASDFVGFKHAFLIRDPARTIASYRAKRGSVEFKDLGLEPQLEFFKQESDRLGHPPAVLDASDVASNAESSLRNLCLALGIEWTPKMLTWEAGRHLDDGIWASHWYGAVDKSTGFATVESDYPDLTSDERKLNEQCMPFYQELARYRL